MMAGMRLRVAEMERRRQTEGWILEDEPQDLMTGCGEVTEGITGTQGVKLGVTSILSPEQRQ